MIDQEAQKFEMSALNEVSNPSVVLGRLGVPALVKIQLKISDETIYSTDFDYFETVNAVNTMTSIRNNIEGKENFIINNENKSGCELIKTVNDCIDNLNRSLRARIAATRKSVSDQADESNEQHALGSKKGKLPRLQRIFDKFNAEENEQKIVMYLLNPVHPDHVDMASSRYPYRETSDGHIKINELAAILQLDIGEVMRVLNESKFAVEKFFKFRDASVDRYGYVYDDGEHSQSVVDPKFVTPLHSIALKKSIRQILIGANPNSSSFIALSSTTLQVLYSLLVNSLTHLLTHLLTHSLTQSLTNSLTHLLTHLLTHSLTHSLTYSLTHSLTHAYCKYRKY